MLFRADDIEAFVAAPAAGGAGDIRLVTFESIAGARETAPHAKPFAAPLVERFGIAVAHVVPRRADWYTSPSVPACLAALRRAVPPDAVAYGSSMGGYAVAHFADAIGLSRGILLSPQVSIQSAVVPFERRWRAEAAAIAFGRDDRLEPRRARLWIFVDPHHAEDLAHAEAIAAAGPAEIVPVPHGGHPVGPALAEAGALAPIVGLFLNGAETPGAVADLVARAATRSPTVLVNRARTLRGPAREAMLHEALALDPAHAKAAYTLGCVLMQGGRTEAANAAFAIAVRPPFRNRARAEGYRAACRKAGVPAVLLGET